MSICPICADKISMYVDILRGSIGDKLTEDFNMIYVKPKDIPIIDCVCNHEFVIVFDFYTPKVENGYELILNCICKGCQGYRNVRIDKVRFPVMIKGLSPHTGISLNKKDVFLDEEKDSVDRSIYL